MDLTVYYHPLASYCHKVLIALYENGTAFERRIIDLGDAADRAALQSIWPLAKFPVIRDHLRKRDVAETSIIIEYLDRFFPGKQPMIPEDVDAALQVRLWDRLFDQYVQGSVQEIVYDKLRNVQGDLATARATLDTVYRMLDLQLTGKTWVADNRFSLADCAAAPALFYASTLQPLPDSCTYLQAYFDRLMARPSVQRVLVEAKPYFSLYPFYEAIPARFL